MASLAVLCIFVVNILALNLVLSVRNFKSLIKYFPNRESTSGLKETWPQLFKGRITLSGGQGTSDLSTG